MGRYGPFTRVAMVLMGTLWVAAGGFWLYCLDWTLLFGRGNAWLFAIPTGIVCGGLALLHAGLTPDRRKTFEEEVPDANPDLGRNGWLIDDEV